MILLYLILILIVAGILAAVTAKWNPVLPVIISLAALAIDLVLLIVIWIGHSATTGSAWWIDYRINWIPTLGISLHLAVDGLSFLLVVLTIIIGFVAVGATRRVAPASVDRAGFFHLNICWILAGIMGVFLSLDLFLFYFFWELMLVPMYFLISIWGYENRIYAAYKFFIYTQASGLLMFLAILGLYFVHGRNSGTYTFDYEQLLGTQMSGTMGFLLMSGFLAAFLVKLPVVPLHNWLPDAHTEAPTAGSVILAGLLLKTGAYGLIRFAIPLFPTASAIFAPYGMILGVIGILYGAKLAFAQTDLKRLVAYTSVSHMGFVVLGVYAFNMIAFQGVMMQIIAHAISTGALFVLVGQLSDRIHTRDIGQMGGLWKQVPVMGAMGMIFSMASLGLPGLGNFIAEFLILAGTFKASILMTCLASAGLVAATIYALRIVQKVFLGKENKTWKIDDLTIREKLVMGFLVITIVWLGLFPQKVMNTAEPALTKTLHPVEQTVSDMNLLKSTP